MITTTTTRKEYIENLYSLLDDLNKTVSRWESNLKAARASAEEGSAELLQSLRESRDQAKQKLTEVQNAGEQAWEDLAEGALAAYENLDDAFSKARKRFSKS